MLVRIYALALNTFREAIRNRIVYAIVAFVIILNLFTLVLQQMSSQEPERVVKDTGLFAISFFGSITAIVLGVSLLYNELKKRTVHTILAKPIGRGEFVLGKYLGMCSTLTLLVLIFTVAFTLVLWLSGMSVDAIVAKATVLHFLEILVVAAIATFFSSFSTPFLSGIFTLGVWFIGRVTPEMRLAVDSGKFGDAIGYTLETTMAIMPDMFMFSPSSRTIEGVHWSIHGQFLDWSYVAMAAGYAAAYIAVCIALAMVIFTRRDFT